MGKHDISSWPHLRKKFGESRVRIYEGETEIVNKILREWGTQKNLHALRGKLLTMEITKKTTCRTTEELNELITEGRDFIEHLRNASEDDLAFFWRVRNTLDKESKIRLRTAIWDECERRYEGFQRKPITLNMPYFREIDGQAVMKLVRGIIDKKPWPKFLKDYSIQKVNLITTGQKTVGDILSNVTKTWTHKQRCVCNEVKERLRKAGYKGELPETDGHIFFIGRDYKGPGQRAMNVCTKNVPISTKWDLKIKWEQLHKQLPKDFCGKHKWAKSLYECTRESFKTRQRLWPLPGLARSIHIQKAG